MIISQERIIRAFIYSVILGIVVSSFQYMLASNILLGMPAATAVIVVHALSALCGVIGIIIWWNCFFGSEKVRFDDWGSGSNMYPTQVPTVPTETYSGDAPAKKDGDSTINLYNKPIKVHFTYSDGKTETILTLDPADIRRKHGYIVGSSRNCDFPINDRTIASMHARLYVAGQILCIQNLGNNNGVRVNNQHLEYEQSAPFPRRGTVYLGGARLDFRG